jgi:hypothetical protein
MYSQVEKLLSGPFLVDLGLVDYPSTAPFLQGVTDNIYYNIACLLWMASVVR